MIIKLFDWHMLEFNLITTDCRFFGNDCFTTDSWETETRKQNLKKNEYYFFGFFWEKHLRGQGNRVPVCVKSESEKVGCKMSHSRGASREKVKFYHLNFTQEHNFKWGHCFNSIT